jgi:hypothetical protein
MTVRDRLLGTRVKHVAYFGGSEMVDAPPADPSFINTAVNTLTLVDVAEFDIADAVGVLHHTSMMTSRLRSSLPFETNQGQVE